FFPSRRRHTSFSRDWSSDVCSSDLYLLHRRVNLLEKPHSLRSDSRVVHHPAGYVSNPNLLYVRPTRDLFVPYRQRTDKRIPSRGPSGRPVEPLLFGAVRPLPRHETR